MNRRTFLLGSGSAIAAAAVLPALPTIAAGAKLPHVIGMDLAMAPDLTEISVVGNPRGVIVTKLVENGYLMPKEMSDMIIKNMARFEVEEYGYVSPPLGIFSIGTASDRDRWIDGVWANLLDNPSETSDACVVPQHVASKQER